MIWIIIIILLLTIAFNIRTFRCFCKSGFVKTIASIMGILLTVVGIFVGVFADNLSQHSKAHSNRYWFSPKTIISFPIEQLKYHALQTDELDLLLNDNLFLKDIVDTLVLQRDTGAVKYIFIVDKTGSGTPTDLSYSEKLEELRKEIKSDLNAKHCTNANLIDNTDNFKYREDLMLAACINAICKDTTGTNTPECQILIYNGENNIDDVDKFRKIQLGGGEREEGIGNIDRFLTDYSFSTSKRNTNFKSIIDELGKSNLINNPERKTVITIFSDFLHEDHRTNVTFEKLDNAIDTLKNVIKKNHNSKEPNVLLNLVLLNYSGSKKPDKYLLTDSSYNNDFGRFEYNINQDVDSLPKINIRGTIRNNETNITNLTIQVKNDTIDEDDKIEQTLNLFRKHFHFEYKNNYKEFSILESDISAFMTYLTAFIRKDKFYFRKLNEKNSISKLTFYYPFSIGKQEQMHSALIKFEIDDDILKRKYPPVKSFINISDNSLVPSDFIFRLINTDTTTHKELNLSKNEEFMPFSIDISHLYSAEIDLDKIPTNMVLNISVQDSANYIIKEQIPVQFKTLLPKVLCYTMIIFITLFVVSLFTLVIYFCFKLAICNYACSVVGNTNCKKMKMITSLCFITFIASWLTVKMCLVFCGYIKELWHIEKIDYIYDELGFCFYANHFFTFFFGALILIIAIVLFISKIHECKHKYELHNNNKKNCAYE